MKKILLFAAAVMLCAAGFASAQTACPTNSTQSMSEVTGGVIGGSAGIGNSLSMTQAGVGVVANAGITRTGGTYANINAAGASKTFTLGNAVAGSAFTGGGNAAVMTMPPKLRR